jgi:CRISPR-associated protein Cas2
MLSGYRLMWMMVMFDLPVGTKPERKQATGFRKHLLDLGFEMSQFSVYLRFCSGKEHTESLTRQIEGRVPKAGKVHILFFTDKQYENIVSFHGRVREEPWKNPEQFALF